MSDENTLEVEALEPEALETEQPEELDSLDSEQDEADNGDTAAKPKQSGFQKRINELVADREDWKRQAQYFAEIAKDKETKPAATVAEAPSIAPKADDFDTYEDFIDALTDFKTDQKLAARDESQKATAAETRKTEAQQAQQTAMQAKISEGRGKYDDFDSVALSGNVPITQEMALAIGDSDVGADLAYYLGTHHDEAVKIANMNPIASLRAMGKLEAKLESEPVTTATKSSAPAPITPVSKTSKVSTDPEKMSVDEWMKWRQKTG